MALIELDHVTKEFRLGQLTSLRQAAANLGRRLTGRAPERRRPFVALNDISFAVESGEVLGIIGHNGAGKSTMLKLLANVTQPTRGRLRVQGRVAPLIEVGAGLVPDLTGRENIYLNGAILGMRKKEIDRKFDEIVAFAELEAFVDTPIKRYSSGMQVKLGFSVATCVESEILIVDEVLAVGDLAFQRKCFDRMEDIIKRQNRTVLLVSHNIRQVARLCTRAILLEHGQVSMDGNPEEVCNLFYEHSNATVKSNQAAAKLANARVDSSGEVELHGVQVLDEQGAEIDAITSGAPLRVRVEFELHRELPAAELVIGTHTTDFVYLTASSTAAHGQRPTLAAGHHVVEHRIPYFPMVAGEYSIRFSLIDGYRRQVFEGENLKSFKVLSSSNELHEPSARTLHIPGRWSVDAAELA